jgi:Big-like domain-containing protein
MSLMRVSRLLATGAVSTALAVGGLSLATAAADAATTSATYTCASTLPIPPPLNAVLAPSFTVPATFTATNLPSVATANLPVPAGVPVLGTFDFNGIGSAGLGGLLTNLGLTLQSTLSTVLGQAGAGAAVVPINGAFSQLNGGIATLNGQLGSFTPSSAGDLPVPVPTSFDFATVLPVLDPVGYHCTLNNPAGTAPIGVVHVRKADSKVKAKSGPVHKGQKATVAVKVKSPFGKSITGQVVAKLHGKTIGHGTLKKGKARLHLKKLAVGVHKVKVTYLGNAVTNASTKKVAVRVLRP